MKKTFLTTHRRHNARDERGSELIEFALVSMLLFSLVFGVMELGRAIWIYDTVAHLAREGARYAMVRGSESGRMTTQGTEAAIRNYVNSVAAGMTGLVVTATWDDVSKDPGTVVQVKVDHAFQPVFPVLKAITLSATSRMVIAF